MGNFVINTAIVFRDKKKHAKSKAIAKRYKRQSVAGVLSYCLRLSADAENEAMRVFREHMDKLEEMEEDKEMQMMLDRDFEM